ncbi:MAG: cell wall-binding protein [Lachnospiraceae bacterium]|jgi:glucan-binding YG repeat protein|nr:cell wall-binding protein [Lachnospiraceae bacterium]
MKKNVKTLAVLSTAALMAAVTPYLAGSFPALAPQALAASKAGWTGEGEERRYMDSDGYYLTDTWKKLNDEWYYLNEDGYVARSTMVDEYYVDQDGKRVSNQWVGIPNEEEWDDEMPETFWYYYGGNGKAVVSKWQNIDGKNYYFNEEGHMQTGKLELDGYTYYLGADDDGVMKTGWVMLESEEENPDEEFVWHYFDNKGRMVMNQVDRKIGGNYYTFENGIMQTGWYKLPQVQEDAGAASADAENTASAGAENAENAGAADAENAGNADAGNTDAENAGNADAGNTDAENAGNAGAESTRPAIASYQYYEEDGKRANGWYEIEGVEGISEEGEIFRFYFKNGAPLHAETGVQTFNVDSRRFAFNTSGEMQTGLQVITLSNGETVNSYFGEDGVMRTGKQVILNEDLDENQTWFFLTDGGNKGHGVHGVRDNCVYSHGLRLDADRDLRYEPVELDGVQYLVNTSGSIQKASSSSKSSEKPELGSGFKDFKDSNDKIWTVNTNGVIQQ